MDYRINKLEKQASDILEKKREYQELEKINATDLSLMREVINIPVEDGFASSQIESVLKTVNAERSQLDEKIEENQHKSEETLEKTDDYLTGLEGSVRKLKQMAKLTDLVDVNQEIENARKMIDELNEIKRLLDTDSGRDSSENLQGNKPQNMEQSNDMGIIKHDPGHYMSDVAKAENAKSVKKGVTPESSKGYSDNGYKFRTDDQGRTVLVEGWLKNYDGERNKSAQIKAGGTDRIKYADEGGHIIAHIFGIKGEAINLTAMNVNLNRGEIKRMENFLKSQLNSGKDVFFQVKILYNSDVDNSHLKQGIFVDSFLKNKHFNGEDVNSKRPVRYDVNALVYDKDRRLIDRSYRFYNTSKEMRKQQSDLAKIENKNEVKTEELAKRQRIKEVREIAKRNRNVSY
ncbi:MAG: DNA/RNA non-specific endonuclease [Nitrososphaerota archaeon]|jgi:hypothetical protein|nr:DNA/RNA non-specific endonuclease [Nitrososphaerota archaeon]